MFVIIEFNSNNDHVLCINIRKHIRNRYVIPTYFNMRNTRIVVFEYFTRPIGHNLYYLKKYSLMVRYEKKNKKKKMRLYIFFCIINNTLWGVFFLTKRTINEYFILR